MEDQILLAAKILGQNNQISKSFPQLARRLTETPILTLVYEEPIVNQQEMEDYHQSFSTMVYHLYATSTGNNSGLISSNISPNERKLIDTIFLQDDDPKEMPDEIIIDKKDTEIVETSENINFPDFPTYPPEDDVYIEPDETVLPE